MTRLRLLPVLVFGLVSLLSIKLLSLALAPSVPGDGSLGSRVARSVTIAREGTADDLVVTGSVPKKKEEDKKKDDDKKPAKPMTEAEKAEMEKARAEFNRKAEPEGARMPPPNTPGVMNGGSSAEERALLEKLKDRRGEIEARDRDLELRDNLIKMGERKLDERIGELRTLESQIGQNGAKTDVKTRYRPLVVMYENMKPKEAARVFDRMDVRILIDLIGHMNPRKMSEILAAMDPAAAEKVTVALARQAAQGDAQVAENGQPDTELQRLPVPGTPRR